MSRDRGIFERPPGSGVWYVRYKDEHGRLHKEKVGPKGLAQKVYQKRKTEIAERRFFPEKFKRRDVLLADMIDDYLARVHGRMRSFVDWKRTDTAGTSPCPLRRSPRLHPATLNATRRFAAPRARPTPA